MNYVVLDMEWNQAITYTEMVKNPVFLTGEIIQIGAVMLNDEFHAVRFFNDRVIPQYYTELHPQVAEVTKLEQRDLRNGKPFVDVFSSFCDWCGSDFAFLIWGTEDLRIMVLTPASCPCASIFRMYSLIKSPMILANIACPGLLHISMKRPLRHMTHSTMPRALCFCAIIWIC